MALHLLLESLLRQFLGLVQPGCTVESVSIPAGHLDHLGRLGPPYLAKLPPRDPRQMLLDRHQVISLPPRFGKSLLEKFIEGLQVFESPVLPGPNFAQVLT